jgi:hypothetical protein
LGTIIIFKNIFKNFGQKQGGPLGFFDDEGIVRIAPSLMPAITEYATVYNQTLCTKILAHTANKCKNFTPLCLFLTKDI